MIIGFVRPVRCDGRVVSLQDFKPHPGLPYLFQGKYLGPVRFPLIQIFLQAADSAVILLAAGQKGVVELLGGGQDAGQLGVVGVPAGTGLFQIVGHKPGGLPGIAGIRHTLRVQVGDIRAVQMGQQHGVHRARGAGFGYGVVFPGRRVVPHGFGLLVEHPGRCEVARGGADPRLSQRAGGVVAVVCDQLL